MMRALIDRIRHPLYRVSEMPLPPPRPTLREIAAEAPSYQLIAVFGQEIGKRSDIDPTLLRNFAHLMDRWADEIERTTT